MDTVDIRLSEERRQEARLVVDDIAMISVAARYHGGAKVANIAAHSLLLRDVDVYGHVAAGGLHKREIIIKLLRARVDIIGQVGRMDLDKHTMAVRILKVSPMERWEAACAGRL